MSHKIPKACGGEVCRVCKAPAAHKVEETPLIDPVEYPPGTPIYPWAVPFHPLTAYLCCEHFTMIMGPATPCEKGVVK